MRDTARAINPLLLIATTVATILAIVGWFRPVPVPAEPVAGTHKRAGEQAESRDSNREFRERDDRCDADRPAGGHLDADITQSHTARTTSAGDTVPPPALAGAGVITGAVYGPDGAPAPGIKVAVTPDIRGNVGEPWPDTLRDLPFDERGVRLRAALERNVVTNNSGHFRVDSLIAGFVYAVRCDEAMVTRLAPVGASIDFYISAACMIRGVVQTRSGEPVTECIVRVRDLREYARSDGVSHSFYDPEGRFALAIDQPTLVELRAICSGYAMAEPLTVSIGLDGADVELIVDRAASLTGTVRDVAGEPVAGVVIAPIRLRDIGAGAEEAAGVPRRAITDRIEADTLQSRSDKGSPLEAQQLTDALGTYRFDNLLPGTYHVSAAYGQATAYGRIELDTTGDRLDLVIDTGAQLVVTVLDETAVPLVGRLGVIVGRRARRAAAVSAVRRLAPNVHVFDKLPRGLIHITLTQRGYEDHAIEVDLSAGDAAVEIQMQRSANVIGTLHTRDGAPLGGLFKVAVVPPGAGMADPRSVTAELVDGAFMFAGMPRGTYELVVIYGSGHVHHRFPPIELTRDTPDQRLIVDSSLLRLDIHAEAFGCFPLEVEVLQRESANDPLRFTVYSEGVVDLFFLPPGQYRVRASADDRAVAHAELQLHAPGTTVPLTVRVPDCVRVIWTERLQQRQPGLDLQLNDLIIAYDGEPVKSASQLSRLERATSGSSESVALTIERAGVAIVLAAKGGPLGVAVEAYARGQ